MIILTIRTDKPEAEIGIFGDSQKLDYVIWQAHLKLAESINSQILKILKKNNLGLINIEGIVCYLGPGSYTGLRIGLSVGNALSYGLKIPIVGSKSDDWIDQGIINLLKGKNNKTVLPFYGGNIYLSKPKQ